MELNERQINQLKVAYYHLDGLNAYIPNPELRKESEAKARVAIENTLRELGLVFDDPVYGAEIKPSQCEHVCNNGERCEEDARYHSTESLLCTDHYQLSQTLDPQIWIEVETR